MSFDWDPGTRPWHRGRGPMMRPPSRLRTRIVLVVVAGAVGFLVGVQALERGGNAGRLAAESPEDLTRILSDLNAEADRLAREISALRVKEEQYRSSVGEEDVLLEDARKALADLQVLSGRVPVSGPGITLRIGDPQERVGWESILDVVQELRDAGAEAIAVGEARVVAATWFGPARGGISVEGVRVPPPFEIRAIGSPAAIREAMQIPGGPLTLLSALPGVRVDLIEQDEIVLPALQREMMFRYARPA